MPRASTKPKGKIVPKPSQIFMDMPAVQKVLDDQSGEYVWKIDHSGLFALAATHASFDQLATALKVPLHVLSDPSYGYRAIIEEARAEALINLRSAQFKAAVEDRNPTMQIWLGKQYLGQKDIVHSQDLDEHGNPVRKLQGPMFVAVMPLNGRDLSQTRQLPAGDKVPTDATVNGVPVSVSQEPAA
jgi:hypothetical protein